MGKMKSVKSEFELAKYILERYEKQTCKGYTIKCIDGQFLVSGDCFKFSDFLNRHHEGKSQLLLEILRISTYVSNSLNFKLKSSTPQVLN